MLRTLTYMSIRVEINNRIAEGRLFRLRPHVQSDPNERTVLMSSEIHQLVSAHGLTVLWALDVAIFEPIWKALSQMM
jgi:hypothetical protein